MLNFIFQRNIGFFIELNQFQLKRLGIVMAQLFFEQPDRFVVSLQMNHALNGHFVETGIVLNRLNPLGQGL